MTDLFGNDIFEGFRALTWKEPFATLMLFDKIETRTWDTSYRGKVLLCAGLGEYTEAELLLMCGPALTSQISFMHCDPAYGINKGHAFAIGDLVNTRPMKPQDEARCFVRYDPTLMCHEYSNVQRIQPFAFTGKLSWTILSKDDLNKIQLL